MRQPPPDSGESEHAEEAEGRDPEAPENEEEVVEGGIPDAGGGRAAGSPAGDKPEGREADIRDASDGAPAGVVEDATPAIAETNMAQSGESETDSSATEAAKKTKPPPAAKKVCFTYDDGPEKGTADVLNAHAGKVPITFFLTGTNMASSPVTQKQLIERMFKEGHQIGNHTFTHNPETSKQYLKKYGDLSDPAKLKKFQDNFNTNEQHFRKLLGSKSPVFKLARLPGNGRFVKIGGKLVYVVATQGMGLAHVTWHFELGTNGSFGHLKAKDWQKIKGVASENAVLPGANAIILMHDRHWNGKQASVETILKLLVAKGYTFGRINSSGTCG
jgi:peptidoglycan/xylan/chitin deacetylase (PgdA/CDA1 family)